jgi:putative PIN family toxin of toxin-antitoxin system
MRVVVDTNVLIAGVLWQSTPHRIIELAEEGHITLCASPAMLAEFERVLKRRKFQSRLRLRRTSLEEIMSLIMPLLELYAPSMAEGSVPLDPTDEMFIACALSANAEPLISGDDHLLGLRTYGHIRIVSPAEFTREIEGSY